MLLRKIAPVLFLFTGACFATRNDVRILQDDIQKLRDSVRVTATRDAQRDADFRETLIRLQRQSSDSLMIAIQNVLNNTGGNLTSSQRGLGETMASILAQLAVTNQQLKTLSDAQGLLGERMTGIEVAFAKDSTRAAPVEGPLAKMAAGKEQMAQGSFSVARNLFIEVINETSDTAILAEAHKELGDAYQADQKLAEADSVFKLLHDKYPTSQFAPYALYKRAVIMVQDQKRAEARVILNRVINDYKNSTYVQQARELLSQIGGPPG